MPAKTNFQSATFSTLENGGCRYRRGTERSQTRLFSSGRPMEKTVQDAFGFRLALRNDRHDRTEVGIFNTQGEGNSVTEFIGPGIVSSSLESNRTETGCGEDTLTCEIRHVIERAAISCPQNHHNRLGDVGVEVTPTTNKIRWKMVPLITPRPVSTN